MGNIRIEPNGLVFWRLKGDDYFYAEALPLYDNSVGTFTTTEIKLSRWVQDSVDAVRIQLMIQNDNNSGRDSRLDARPFGINAVQLGTDETTTANTSMFQDIGWVPVNHLSRSILIDHYHGPASTSSGQVFLIGIRGKLDF